MTRTFVLEVAKSPRHREPNHNRFVPRSGTIPDHSRLPAGHKRTPIQLCLQSWLADLGARDRMNWRGFHRSCFHRSYCKTLHPLLDLPRLGRLSAGEIERVVGVVQALETFKPTSGRKLVFGSKAAHFHFPWLVPIISSEVRYGLAVLERDHADEAGEHIEADAPWFQFTSAARVARSYQNYVTLGNGLMRGVDGKTFFKTKPPCAYKLHAKIFEWCVVSFDPWLRG